MSDAEIFRGGVFVTLWLVSFFGISAYQLRKGEKKRAPVTKPIPNMEVERDAPIAP